MTIYPQGNKLPILVATAAPAPVREHPAPLTGTPMITLDKVGGVYRRRRHGSYTSTLAATVGEIIASK